MRGARNGKRALLIISDGGDNHSRYSESDIRNFVKEADCQLYAMGVFDVNDMGRTTEERYGPTLLSELAEMTGGRVFPVSSLSDLPDIAAKIGMELRNQYVLGYKPSDARHNGAWRKIKVKLVPPEGTAASQRLRQDRILRARTNKLSLLCAIVALLRSLALALAWPRLRAQQPAAAASAAGTDGRPKLPACRQQGQADYAIQRDVNLVVLHASVVNERGQFVPGLKQEDFRVLEDKVEQKISVFQPGRRAGQHGTGDRQ